MNNANQQVCRGTCSHLGKRLYRVLHNGPKPHVREICPACGANVRGPGVNIPHNQVPVDPDSLPVWKDLRKAPQSTLFEGMQ